MKKIKLSEILKQILLILSILIFARVNSNAGDCPSAINSALTSDCITLSTGVEITSSGSIKLSTITTGALQITREVTGQIINSGEINGPNGQVYIRKNIIGGFTNTITGNIHGNYTVDIGANSTINSFSNAGFIGTDASTRSHFGGVIDLWGGYITGGFINSGDIKALLSADGFLGDSQGIRLVSSTDSITGGIYNSGTIASARGDGIQNGGLIDSITNTGTITGSGYGISNYNFMGTNIGTIGTLNNSQGASSSALTYKGNLPTNYNIIINSTSNYGQLAVANGLGNMAFNIYGYTGQTLTSGVSASSVRNNYLYQNVLTGLISSLSGSTITGTGFSITGAKGSYGGYSYALVADDSNVSGVWDLLFGSLGPAAADTQSSMQYQASQLRSAFNTQTVAANFALNYDCNVFDAKGMCISAGGRYTTIDNPNINNSAAVVTLGYKVNPNIRIGAYLDQNINISHPTGINISNNTPLMGLYAVWNKEQNGLGYQVRLANTYQDKDVTQTRTVFDTSEAGSGKSSLTSQSYLAELSYAFQYEDRTLVRPYAGLRYTHLKQDGYTEGTTDAVTDPLTIASLKDRSATALLGVKVNRNLADKATLTAQLGLEQDLYHKVDNYSATDLNASELTAVAFNSNIKRTRPVASLGAFYDVTKTQRASATINYQQTPFQSTGSATAYFNYMIGF